MSDLPIAEPIELHVDWRGYRSVSVRCPYCAKVHRHGVGRWTDAAYVFAGARVAHCASPTRVTRFYVRPPHVSRSYEIPRDPLEALVAAEALEAADYGKAAQ